jgi:hypothetical protein
MLHLLQCAVPLKNPAAWDIRQSPTLVPPTTYRFLISDENRALGPEQIGTFRVFN